MKHNDDRQNTRRDAQVMAEDSERIEAGFMSASYKKL